MRINTNLATIRQLLVQSLLSSSQKNSYNLINYRRPKTNFVGLGIISL